MGRRMGKQGRKKFVPQGAVSQIFIVSETQQKSFFSPNQNLSITLPLSLICG